MNDQMAKAGSLKIEDLFQHGFFYRPKDGKPEKLEFFYPDETVRLLLEFKGKPKKGVILTKFFVQDQFISEAKIDLADANKDVQLYLPVTINLENARGRSVFKNDAPGLEPSLVAAPLVAGGTTTLWVNDQVQADEPPRRVVAKVGAAKPVTGDVPKLSIERLKLEQDPVDGTLASGKIKNDSGVLQRKLVIYAVARKGGRIVAAGRAGVDRLKPGKKAGFAIFFIGNPKGAKLEVFAPPTVLA